MTATQQRNFRKYELIAIANELFRQAIQFETTSKKYAYIQEQVENNYLYKNLITFEEHTFIKRLVVQLLNEEIEG